MSKIVNNGSSIIDALIMLSIVPVFFVIKKNYNIERHLYLACIINLFPLLFILKLGNTLGIIITFIGVVTINSTIRKLAEKGFIFTYLIIVMIFSILILITQCRTCLISFFVIAFINYVYILKVSNKEIKKKKLISIFFVLICAVVCSGVLYNLMFHKYGNTAFDITTGRGIIWKKVITDDIKFLGNYDNYFTDFVNKGDAHNVYVQALGHYGIIVLILYIILNMYILLKLIKKRKKLEHINFFLNYFIIGMFENLLFMDTKIIIVNVLMFLHIGMLLKEDDNYYCFNLLKDFFSSLNIKSNKKLLK